MHPSRLLRQTALDPYQVLSIPRSASKGEIKSAYYALMKVYHPDIASSSSSSSSPSSASSSSSTITPGTSNGKKPKGFEFTDISAAYDLLRDNRRREQYLRYGLGWNSSSSSPSSPSSSNSSYNNRRGFAYDETHNPWGQPIRKSRPMRHAYERPRYPSSSWDFAAHADSTEFFYRNPKDSTNGSTMNTEGQYVSNYKFFGILAGCSLVLYSVQFWRLAPPMPGNSSSSINETSGNSTSTGHTGSSLSTSDPREALIYKNSSWMRGRDAKHDEASKALGAAREGAQRYGMARRDGIR